MQPTTLKDAVCLMRSARGMLASHRCSEALELYEHAIAFLSKTLDADSELIQKAKAVAAWLRAAAARDTAGARVQWAERLRWIMLIRNQAAHEARDGQFDLAGTTDETGQEAGRGAESSEHGRVSG
jgi:hypothetical protein